MIPLFLGGREVGRRSLKDTLDGPPLPTMYNRQLPFMQLLGENECFEGDLN